MIKILHVITGLDTGGAETSLIQLATTIDARRFTSAVVSLTTAGPGAKPLGDAGIAVEALGMLSGAFSPRALFRLSAIMRRSRPDVVQTWLYHADLAGSLAAAGAGIRTVCWNVRCAELERADHPRSLLVIRKILAWMSPLPAGVVANSVAGQRAHLAIGYRPKKWKIISNGFDTTTFSPSPARRIAYRNEFGISDSKPLVGMVARWHPMKDHATFLRAAAIVRTVLPETMFVLAGRGVDAHNVHLERLLDEHGLREATILLGEVADTAGLYAALDVAVSSSYSEAMPNVVGEAMASGAPCVATDAGDSARLIGDAGVVVPVRNPEALSDGIKNVLLMSIAERNLLGARARARIEAEFSSAKAVEQYEHLYEELAS